MIGDRIEVNIAGGLDIPLPKMVPIKVTFDSPKLDSIDQAVAEQFKNPEIREKSDRGKP